MKKFSDYKIQKLARDEIELDISSLTEEEQYSAYLTP